MLWLSLDRRLADNKMRKYPYHTSVSWLKDHRLYIGDPFQNIVIFGDSLSDNGNVYAITNETYPIPSYWKGRFSNGRNWVDQLDLSGISDYAYGSATTDSNLVQGYTKGNKIPVPGMLQQVQLYLNNTNVNTITAHSVHWLALFWKMEPCSEKSLFQSLP
jgi:phospholipase/lecithinase/hemolysin